MHLKYISDDAWRHQETTEHLCVAFGGAAAGMEWSLLEFWEVPFLKGNCCQRLDLLIITHTHTWMFDEI